MQLNIVHSPWDPLFGPSSSFKVLHSRFAESLPFPDALAGAVTYLLEAGLGIVAARSTWHACRIGYGLVVVGMALAGLVLVALQGIAIHHFCLLCTMSAAISWLILVLVIGDVVALWHKRESGGRAVMAFSTQVPPSMSRPRHGFPAAPRSDAQ